MRPEPPSRLPRRFPLLALAIFLGLSALLVTPTLGDMGGDSAQYLALAEGLAKGEGYRDAYLPGAPLHGHFPPGLPILLLPVVGLFGAQAWLASKILLLLMAALGLALAFLYLEKRFGSRVALASLILTASSGSVLTTSVRIQSEMPYLLVAFLCLLLLENQNRKAALIAAWASAAIRLTGLATCMAWAIPGSSSAGSDALHRRAGRLVLALLPLLVFWAYGRLFARGTWGYGAELLDASGGISGLPMHIAEGLRVQGLHLGRLLGDGIQVSRWTGLQVLLAGIVLLGLVRRIRMGLQAGEVFFLSTLALAVLAPRPLERYLIPILPLSAAYAIEALEAIPRLWSSLRRADAQPPIQGARIALLLPLLLLSASHVQAVVLLLGVRQERQVVDPPPLLAREVTPVDIQHWEEAWIFGDPLRVARIRRNYADFLMVLELCEQRLPETAVIVAAKPRLVSYLTARPCLPLPTGRVLQVDGLIRLGATHVLVDGLFASTRQALPGGGDRLGLQSVAAVRSCACFLLVRAPE